jgi:hypothetical protein
MPPLPVIVAWSSPSVAPPVPRTKAPRKNKRVDSAAHPREGGDPAGQSELYDAWIPAFAGMSGGEVEDLLLDVVQGNNPNPVDAHLTIW